MKSDFLLAVTQLATERRLPRDVVVDAIENALASAFKKEFIGSENISVRILPTTGDILLTVHKIIVDSVEDTENEISIEDALQHRADAQLGETLDIIVETPEAAGRIAAQTAKQVVLQRLREAEKNVVYEEYATRLNQLISGVVQRIEEDQIVINLGRTQAIMPNSESVESEHYRPGQRIRVIVKEVERGINGARIIVSRSSKNLIQRLFELEVPEVTASTVILKAIAREPGYRTKVAVETTQSGIDPVGACVGLRGVRIQNIVNELNGEKIDVIPWSQDTALYISQALSPSEVSSVKILGERRALVIVPDTQLSLAIGRDGQNARLAAKLTGYRIDISSESEISNLTTKDSSPLTTESIEKALIPDEENENLEDQTETEARVVAEDKDPAIAEEPLETTAGELAVEEIVDTQEEAVVPDEAIENENIEKALQELEKEEARLEEELKSEEITKPEPEESFDFDKFLKGYQADKEDDGTGIRFAEDIFPEQGGRFRDGRSGGNNRRGGGQSGGRKGGGR